MYTTISKTVSEDGVVLRNVEGKHYNPFKAGRGYNYKYKSSNIRIYLDTEPPAEFTVNEIGRLVKLAYHIYSNSNLLAKRVGGIIIPLDKEEISEIVGLSRARFSSFMTKAKRYKMIKLIEYSGSEYYCFSPIYFNSTRYIPLHLYLAFQDELETRIPELAREQYLEWYEKVKAKEQVAPD
jgi:hypothetical protein